MNARTNSHITSNAKRNARGAAPLLAALLAALALGACGRQDDGMTAGQKVDQSVAQAEQKSAEASAQIKEAGRDVAEAAKDVGNKVVTSDAAITTTVNAELAKDQKLSALKINVDTVQGRVELRGTAPDAESKDRATRIAANVKGVSSVENLLTVEAKS